MTLHPYVRIFLSVACCLAIFAAFAGAYELFGAMDDVLNDSRFLQAHNIGFGAAWIAVTFLLFRKLDRKKPRELGFGFDRRDAMFLLCSLAISFAFAAGFAAALHQWTTVRVGVRTELLRSESFYLLLLLSCFGWAAAALKEEVLARGYIMYQLRRLGVGGMIAGSSVLFMVIHFPNGIEWTKAASWLLGGVLYGYIYLKSGSLTVSTGAHGIHNLVNELFLSRADDFAWLALSGKVDGGDKLIYEIVLKLVLLALTYRMYRRTGGVLTPADNLTKLWGRHGGMKPQKST